MHLAALHLLMTMVSENVQENKQKELSTTKARKTQTWQGRE
jgi:hypothetical protein